MPEKRTIDVGGKQIRLLSGGRGPAEAISARPAV